MILQAELTSYLKQFLSCDIFNDYAPNGLQIQGKQEIQRICTAVSVSEDVISQAASKSADALIVHHGFFWRGEDPTIRGMKYKRISALLKSDINLYAYHLPLDCHIELGNNACVAQLLEAVSIEQHNALETPGLLWSGKIKNGMSAESFGKHLSNLFKQTPQWVNGGSNNQISQVAWCTGAAEDLITQACELGADAYISGEISERTFYQAKELGIHYYACGHHASERYGIQALGTHLAKNFKLQHDFIEVDNPV